MKRILSACVVVLVAHMTHAQQPVVAYAKNENTYLRFTKEDYDASKKYTIIRLSPKEKKSNPIAGLDNVANVVDCAWSSSEDLDKVLPDYGIKSTMHSNNLLQLDGPNYSVNTTSDIAYLVLLDQKIQLLCCGNECEKRLAAFFVTER